MAQSSEGILGTELPAMTETEVVLNSHLPMLRGYLRHLLGSVADADDVAQDVCVAILQQPDLLLKGSQPAAYLRGIARHLAFRHQRKIHREVILEDIIDLAWDAPAVETGSNDARQAVLSH